MSQIRTSAVDQRTPGGGASARAGSGQPLNVVIGLEGLALGGCPINALDLGRALRDRGHQVSVFAIDEDVRVSLIPYAEQCGFSVTVFPAGAGFLSRSWHIRQFARSKSADVVHLFAPWLGPAAAMAAVTRRPRLVMVTNWMMENVSYTPGQMPMMLGTRALQEEAQLSHRSRVWLIEPPVDLSGEVTDPDRARRFRRDLGIADDETLAVIVSRIDSHMKAEGIVNTIRAIRELDLTDLKLVIVGDGNAVDLIRRESETVNRDLGREAVILAGALYDPRPAYAAADITLGMGGSALRCLAHSKPLIVLGENGFARIFEPASEDYFMTEGFFGSQHVDNAVGHVAEQIRQLMDTEVRARLGEYGLARVAGRFGLDVTADTLEDIYRTEIADVPGLGRRCLDAVRTVSRAVVHRAVRAVRRTS